MPDPAQRRTPEEWCAAYGLTVLDPDGWRMPSAPAWTDPVGLAEFYHRAIESTTDGAFTGAFTRIAADLDAWAATVATLPPLPEPDYLPGYPGKSAKRPDWLDPQPRQWTAEEVATYYLDHCGNCRDAEFYGHKALHAKHVPVIEDGQGPLAGQPCACKTCAQTGTVGA